MASLSWAVVAAELAGRAARGLSVRFDWSDGYLLLDASFRIFLLMFGFSMLEGIFRRGTPLRQTMGLPRRASAAREWASGAAIGWAVVLLAVLPMMLAGKLNIRLWFAPRSCWLTGLNLVAVALLALATEMTFGGIHTVG